RHSRGGGMELIELEENDSQSSPGSPRAPSKESASRDAPEESCELNRLLRTERTYAHSLLDLIQSLRERLRGIESSRWWRLRVKYQRFRALLWRALAANSRLAWLRKLLSPFTDHGRRLLHRALISRLSQPVPLPGRGSGRHLATAPGRRDGVALQ